MNKDYTSNTSKTRNTYFSTHTLFIVICVVWVLGTIGFITIALTTGDLESIALILIGLTLSLPCLYVIMSRIVSENEIKDTKDDAADTTTK